MKNVSNLTFINIRVETVLNLAYSLHWHELITLGKSVINIFVILVNMPGEEPVDDEWTEKWSDEEEEEDYAMYDWEDAKMG